MVIRYNVNGAFGFVKVSDLKHTVDESPCVGSSEFKLIEKVLLDFFYNDLRQDKRELFIEGSGHDLGWFARKNDAAYPDVGVDADLEHTEVLLSSRSNNLGNIIRLYIHPFSHFASFFSDGYQVTVRKVLAKGFAQKL